MAELLGLTRVRLFRVVLAMKHTEETIGPDEARALLKKLMPHYRPLDEKQVEDYAKLMRQGAWMPSSEPIHVDEELGLVNGRRRLVAPRARG